MDARRGRALRLAYALAANALALAAVAAFAARLLGLEAAPRPGVAPPAAAAIDLALVALFGVQHSVMARPGFKRWWTRAVPPPVERATYVLAAAVALALVAALWQPFGPVLWDLRGGARVAMLALFGAGATLLVAASAAIGALELFGIDQARGRVRVEPATLRRPALYRLVRHPIMLGTLVTLWAAPRMTGDHLLLSIAFSAYIAVALRYEERDLEAELGEAYRRYRREVPKLLPWPRPRR